MPTKESNPNLFRRLAPYYKHLIPVKWYFIGGILASLLYSIASGFGLPLMAKTAFPVIFNDEKEMANVPEAFLNFVNRFFGEDPQQGLLLASVISLPLMMLLRSLGHFFSGYLMGISGLKVSEAIRSKVFEHIQTMPLAFFHKYKSGDLLARTMSDTESIKKAVVELSTDLIKQPMTLISAIGFLVYRAFKDDSFFFALAAVVSAPIIIFPIRAIGKKLSKKAKQLAYSGAELTSFTTESLQSPLEIRAYNLQESIIGRFQAQINRIVAFSIKRIKYNLFANPLIEVVAALSLSFALYVGVSNGMGLGDFMSLAIALYMAYEPVKKLGKIHGALRSLEAPLERLEQILEEDNTVPEPYAPIALPERIKGDITFKNVSFTYDGKISALNDLNCQINSGDVVALVGSSGSGKTTFINLIPRFYHPTEGKILIDGIDISSFKKSDLRCIISYVPQMPILFNASIADNIKVGKLDATQEEVEAAAKHAFAHDFIIETEQGYDTILAERGGSLSGGQRQRVAIARAFLKNAPILILDEATSALDNESEEMITKALDELMKGKTTLMIAHRESSLRSATRKLTFQNGQAI